MSAAAGTPTAFDWRSAMHLGLGRLRLLPRDFWAMTPAELAATAGFFAPPPDAPGRAMLEALMARFPDRADDEEETA